MFKNTPEEFKDKDVSETCIDKVDTSKNKEKNLNSFGDCLSTNKQGTGTWVLPIFKEVQGCSGEQIMKSTILPKETVIRAVDIDTEPMIQLTTTAHETNQKSLSVDDISYTSQNEFPSPAGSSQFVALKKRLRQLIGRKACEVTPVTSSEEPITVQFDNLAGICLRENARRWR